MAILCLQKLDAVFWRAPYANQRGHEGRITRSYKQTCPTALPRRPSTPQMPGLALFLESLEQSRYNIYV